MTERIYYGGISKDERIGSVFSQRLDHIMVEQRVASKLLADRVGLSQAAVHRYRLGEHSPSVVCAVKIAQVLGVSMDWLCGLEGDIHDYDVG